MASTSFVSSSNNFRLIAYCSTAVSSIWSRTTTVTVTLKLRIYSLYMSPKAGSITVNGQTYSFNTPNIQDDGTALHEIIVASHAFTEVKHSSDGSLYVSLSSALSNLGLTYQGVYYSSLSASGGFWSDSINVSPPTVTGSVISVGTTSVTLGISASHAYGINSKFINDVACDSSRTITGLTPNTKYSFTAKACANNNVANTYTGSYTTPPIVETSIAMSSTQLTLYEGASSDLNVTFTPSNCTFKDTVWSTSNSAVATVNSSGNVTSVSKGTCTITATSHYGKTATCAVTVKKAVTGVTLNKASTLVYNGSTETLIATVSPSTASVTSVTWSSSNTSIATVSNTGVVTAISTGSCVIKATSPDDPTKYAQCTVSCEPPYKNKMFLKKSDGTFQKGTIFIKTGSGWTSEINIFKKTASTTWSKSAN